MPDDIIKSTWSGIVSRTRNSSQIFDKLDNKSVKQLIQLVNKKLFGQIFISDTDFERTKKILKEIDSTHKIFKL